jgi:hypothetical protein
MFALYCPRHGHRVLLDVGRLTSLVNLGHGLILVAARCYDGEDLIGVTGLHSTLPPDAVARRPTTPPRPATPAEGRSPG